MQLTSSLGRGLALLASYGGFVVEIGGLALLTLGQDPLYAVKTYRGARIGLAVRTEPFPVGDSVQGRAQTFEMERVITLSGYISSRT